MSKRSRVKFSNMLSGNKPITTSKKRRITGTDSASGSKSSSKGKEPEITLDSVLSDPEMLSLDKKVDIIQKQNSKIIKKIDLILNFQNNLETRIANLEEAIGNMGSSRIGSTDKAFINVIKNL
jgi:hypothetical protein